MKFSPTLLIFSLVLGACAFEQSEDSSSGPDSVELALLAEDLQRDRIEEGEAYCGGDVGDLSMEGHYHLESRLNGHLVDTYDLGTMTFVTGQPHDDLHLSVKDIDLEIYKLFQYGGCNFEILRLFLLNADGTIELIPFVKEGETSDYVYTDSEGRISVEGKIFTFCPYDNTAGEVLCDSYEYKEASFNYLSTERYDLETYQNL